MLPLLIPLLAAAQVPPRDAVALTGEDQVREICAALRDEPAREPALGVEPSKARAQVLSRVYRLRVPATGFGFGRYREEHQELELNGDRPLRAIEDALSLDLQGIDDVAFRASPEEMKRWAADQGDGKIALTVFFRPSGERCAGNAAARIFRMEGRPLWWQIEGEGGVLAAADEDGLPVDHGVRARTVTVEKLALDPEPPGPGEGDKTRLSSAQVALDRCAQGARRRGSMVVSFSVLGGRVRDPQVIMDGARDEQTASCVAHALSGAPIAGAAGLSGRGTAAVAVQ